MSVIHAIQLPEQFTALAVIIIGSFLNLCFIFIIYQITKNLTINKWPPLISTFSGNILPNFLLVYKRNGSQSTNFPRILSNRNNIMPKNKKTLNYLVKHLVISILLTLTRIDSLLVILIYFIFNVRFEIENNLKFFKKSIFDSFCNYPFSFRICCLAL